MLKAILFDLDDTLLWDKKSVENAFKATCLIAEKKYAINPDLLEKKVREKAQSLYASYETYAFTQMIGINPYEGLWGDFSDEGEIFQKMKEIVPGYRKETWTKGLQELGINDPKLGYELAETFPTERKKHAYIYDDTFKVLDQLNGKYKLILLTNGSPSLQQTKLDMSPELAPYFEQIVISGGFGKGKPDPAIFEHALGLLSVRKNEALMVGDNLMTDILGATRVGIATVWVNRHRKERSNVVPTYEISQLKELLPVIEKIDR